MMETTAFPGIPPFPGNRESRPREGTFPRPPLAEFDGCAPSFAGNTEDYCVEQAWRGRAAAGGPVAVGRAGALQGVLKLKKF